MAELTSKANIGDVIRSEKFAYGIFPYSENGDGHYAADRGKIHVDGVNQGYKVVYRDPANLANRLDIDVTAHDESRGKALFAVEKAEMHKDKTVIGNKLFQECWHIEARRLNENGSYDENNELISFYQSSGFRNCIPEVELVGKMEITLLQKD